MDINNLACFVEVAKSLNMTVAAKSLFISQQALSLKIQRLEQQYGVQLFERQPKLKLTYAGEIFAERAKTILAENQALINQLSDISVNHSAILRLGIPSSRAGACLPNALRSFNDRWPNVTIQMVDESTPKLLSAVEDGILDMAVVVPLQSDLTTYREKVEFFLLAQERTFIATSRCLLEKHFGAQTESIIEQATQGTTLREFAELPFILHRPPLNLRKIAEECFREAGYKPNIYIEASNTESILSIYSCHLGMFFCRGTRLQEINSRYNDCQAFPLRLKDDFVVSEIYLAQPKYRRPPKYVQEFSELIKLAWRELKDS